MNTYLKNLIKFFRKKNLNKIFQYLLFIICYSSNAVNAASDAPPFSLKNTDFVVAIAFLIFIGVLIYFKVPKIIINLTKTENNLLLVVEDSGIGIPKKIKNKIFKPNFSTKNSNMGLGLAIVKKIIVDLGGTISFEDKKEDGACFHITIPLLKEKN